MCFYICIKFICHFYFRITFCKKKIIIYINKKLYIFMKLYFIYLIFKHYMYYDIYIYLIILNGIFFFLKKYIKINFLNKMVIK